MLYLDSDIVVDRNLSELFTMDMGDHALAAIPDLLYTGKFNSGVLLFNMPVMKKDPHIVEKMLKAGNNQDLQEGDQSVLNSFFKRILTSTCRSSTTGPSATTSFVPTTRPLTMTTGIRLTLTMLVSSTLPAHPSRGSSSRPAATVASGGSTTTCRGVKFANRPTSRRSLTTRKLASC